MHPIFMQKSKEINKEFNALLCLMHDCQVCSMFSRLKKKAEQMVTRT